MKGKKGRYDRKELMKRINTDGLEEYLHQTIDAEMQKPDMEMDTDLIDECVDWLLEIDGVEIAIPEEKIRGITKAIIEKHYKPKRRYINIFTIIAACVVIVVSVQIISEKAFHANLFRDIYEEAEYITHHCT